MKWIDKVSSWGVFNRGAREGYKEKYLLANVTAPRQIAQLANVAEKLHLF